MRAWLRAGNGRALAWALAVVAALSLAALAVAPAPDDVTAETDEQDVDPAPTPSDSALTARLDAYLDASFPETHVPGVAVAVVDADGIVYERTKGAIPDANTPVLIGSLSKSFTAVCVMQLVEQGRVELDAPAASYLSVTGQLPASVTVRDLLNQTSGFGYYDSLSQALERPEPGPTAGSFSYANANYDVLGRIVEDVSGEPYADYLRDYVLLPLGMDRSSGDAAGVLADGTPTARALVAGERNWFGAYVADGFTHASGDGAWGTGPSGYVASSLADLGTYLRMYLDAGAVPDSGGGVRVLEPASVSRMFFDRVPDPGGDTYYGMGWTSFTWDDGELVLSHDGSVEGYCARMVLLPERGVGIVVLTNGSDEVAGSSLFFGMADGVVSVVAGDEPEVPDGSWYVEEHVRDDVVYAAGVLASVVALAWVCRWRGYLERVGVATSGWQGVPERVKVGVVVRVGAFFALAAVVATRPLAWGVPWRDLWTFVPDVSCVLVVTAALLACAGVVRLVVLARVLRRR